MPRSFRIPIPRRSALAVAVVFVVAAGFNYAVMTISTGMMESNHGRFHAGYIYQIFHGIIPPTNVHAAGELANFYWPWHLLLAAIMKVVRIAPFEANAFVGSSAFGTTFVALYLLGRRLGMTLWFALCLPLLALGMHGATSFVLAPFGYEFSGRPPLTSTADKFLNFSSFPTAFAVFALAFCYELSKRSRGYGRLSNWYWLSVLAMGFFSPIVLFAYDLWLAILILTQFDPSMSWSDVRRTSRLELARYWPILLCHLAVVPFVLQLSSLMGGSTEITLEASEIRADLAGMQPTLWAFALAFAAGLTLHLRRPPESEPSRTRWLVWSAPVGLLLYPLIQIPAGNEYKLVLLWSLPLAVAIVLAASELLQERGHALRLAALLVLAAVGSGSILINAWVRTHSQMAEHDPWVFQGTSTRVKGRDPASRSLQSAADWIQRNSAATDFLLVRAQPWDRSPFPVLTQRRIVAAKPSLHTERLPNHARLFELNRLLLDRIHQQKRWISENDASTQSLYEIVGDEQNFFAVVRKTEFERWPSHPSLVYQTPLHAILTPSPEPATRARFPVETATR